MLLQLPWRGANGSTAGNIRTPPVAATSPLASFEDGFPAVTFIDQTLGGVPPDGADMNGVLNQITQLLLWANAGGQWPYNATVATAIGGYPIGAILQLTGGPTVRCTSAGNMNDPNSDLTGWASLDDVHMHSLNPDILTGNGYDQGDMIHLADGTTLVIATAGAVHTNPDTDMTGWAVVNRGLPPTAHQHNATDINFVDGSNTYKLSVVSGVLTQSLV